MTTVPTCREVITFLADYLEGELDPMRTNAFERHLSVCPSCRNYLDSYRRTMEMERDAFSDPVLQDPPEELVAAILAIRKPA